MNRQHRPIAHSVTDGQNATQRKMHRSIFAIFFCIAFAFILFVIKTHCI
ncbi:MAG: hypothetical protein IJU72_07040 [Bacteroidales bacterium]|nr:hypothetical protein [Bacteroidales bacterium]